MMHISLTFLAALAAALPVYGSPAPLDKRDPSPKLLFATDVAKTAPSAVAKRGQVNECQIVNFVVDALKVFSKQAYPFCSSYIHIQSVTSTVTATATVTPSAVSVTSTVTPASVIVTATATATATATGSTSTSYSHYTATPTNKKRTAPTIPPYLKAFASAQISTACSCLSIAPGTTTVTTTTSTTLPASTTTVATITAAAPTSTTTTTTTVTVPQSIATYPALCAPSVLNFTSGVLSSEGVNTFPTEVDSPYTTVLDCCVTCFKTPNCLSYLAGDGPQCRLFVQTVAPSGDAAPANAAQQALCPIGVSTQDTLTPAGVSTDPDPNGFRIGPCVTDADPDF